jgi:hypothetical protein
MENADKLIAPNYDESLVELETVFDRLSNVKLDSSEEESDKELIVRLTKFLTQSPFQVKAKGQSPKQKYFLETDPNWTFGRPAYKKDIAAEFLRAFNELESLGTALQVRCQNLKIDSEMFQIAPNLSAVIAAIQGSSKQSNPNSSTFQTENSSKKSNIDVTLRTSPKISASEFQKLFDQERLRLQKALTRLIYSRNQRKLTANLRVEDMVKIERQATSALRIHLKNKKGIRANKIPVKNIWAANCSLNSKPPPFYSKATKSSKSFGIQKSTAHHSRKGSGVSWVDSQMAKTMETELSVTMNKQIYSHKQIGSKMRQY